MFKRSNLMSAALISMCVLAGGIATAAFATVTTSPPIQFVPIVNAPSSLRVTANGGCSITLAWNDNSSNETGFVVYRRPAGTLAWQVARTLPANSTSAAISAPGYGLFQYQFAVRAYRSQSGQPTVWSPYSNIVAADMVCIH